MRLVRVRVFRLCVCVSGKQVENPALVRWGKCGEVKNRSYTQPDPGVLVGMVRSWCAIVGEKVEQQQVWLAAA